ncbi:hypothetical protein H2199_008992 [Coniosporium tulheliwenetii]|uniref:Uncharacterized protein n=1 Tax=Coniosporium tulheliwenetii TaxID=3383036 RepID=A0ACC2YGT7_9PEZI|nr:hypothetical protein H2199_008992 [Cladosporium sp. JES 115]
MKSTKASEHKRKQSPSLQKSLSPPIRPLSAGRTPSTRNSTRSPSLSHKSSTRGPSSKSRAESPSRNAFDVGTAEATQSSNQAEAQLPRSQTPDPKPPAPQSPSPALPPALNQTLPRTPDQVASYSSLPPEKTPPPPLAESPVQIPLAKAVTETAELPDLGQSRGSPVQEVMAPPLEGPFIQTPLADGSADLYTANIQANLIAGLRVAHQWFKAQGECQKADFDKEIDRLKRQKETLKAHVDAEMDELAAEVEGLIAEIENGPIMEELMPGMLDAQDAGGMEGFMPNTRLDQLERDAALSGLYDRLMAKLWKWRDNRAARELMQPPTEGALGFGPMTTTATTLSAQPPALSSTLPSSAPLTTTASHDRAAQITLRVAQMTAHSVSLTLDEGDDMERFTHTPRNKDYQVIMAYPARTQYYYEWLQALKEILNDIVQGTRAEPGVGGYDVFHPALH